MSSRANPDNRVAVEEENFRAQARDAKEALIAAWRKDWKARTGEDATCTDAVALRLAEMAASVGRL